jgi:phosphoribosylformylglycinamidine synthase
MLGVLEDKSLQTGLGFQQEGDVIFMLGEIVNDISSSEYLYSFHKIKNSPAPYFDLDKEFNVQQAVSALIKKKLVQSAHDVSDGGLFVCLAESCFVKGLGVNIEYQPEIRQDSFLFGESQSRIVVSVKKEMEQKFVKELESLNVPFNLLGFVEGTNLVVDGEDFGKLSDLRNLYDTSLEKIMTK